MPLVRGMRMLLLVWAASARAAPITVFTSPLGEYPCTRIPSASTLPDGTVLAFAECRRWAGDQCFIDGWHNATREQEFNRSICLRRSSDGGHTWGQLQPNITARYSANPTAAHDAARGRTLLFFDDARSGGLYSIASHDSGASWEAPTPLHDDSGVALKGTSGPGNSVVVLPGGTLLLGVYHANKDVAPNASFSHANVLRSADGGASWADVSPRDAMLPGGRGFAHLGEPSLTLLPSGALVLDARCPDGRRPYPGPASPCDCDCRGVAVSRDNGTTWGGMRYDSSVPDPDCQGAVLGLANGTLAFSNAASPSSRTDLSVRLGSVRGDSVAWSDATPVGGGVAAGYSSLTELPGGRGLGVLWETQGGGTGRGCHGQGCEIVLSFL